MDENFIKELRETSREDRRRSELIILGMKETLKVRKEQGRLKRWLGFKRAEKRILRRFNDSHFTDSK
ncbi:MULTISPECIES: hypothetical protein [Paenibacillus]|uniref:hypothetical protein n=1 Tax=Paenibacillus TaxID=44249 RepID=UPI001F3346E2|nr:hypothetical protein [Paenibacillus sp. JJ-223]CAH1205652.1 hypothetical protein PAECIP111890_02703 [Paenibacillus sp. JJ-223]